MSSVPSALSFSIGNSLQQAANQFFAYLPNILGALVVFVIGYIVAKVVRKVAETLLGRLKIDERLRSGHAGQWVESISPGASAARLIGGVVFWAIMVFVISATIGALKIPALTGFMNLVFSYLPNVIAALAIFVVAGAIAGGIAGLVQKTMGDTPTGRIVRTAGPSLVMAIAVFMILTQLRVAEQIVVITYAGLIAALALGSALAFGLGGRGLAERTLSDAYDRGQEQKDQAKADLRTGRERGEQQARQQTQRLQSSGGGQPGSASA